MPSPVCAPALFGRNATGGLVQAVTAKPTKDLEAHASLTSGSFGQIASEAAVSDQYWPRHV